MKDEGGSEEQSVSLGLRLQRARRSAGLTQQQLCQRAKLAYSTLAKIERGAIKSPSVFTVQTIASVLGVSVDTLLGNNSPTPLSNKKISKSGIRFVYFDINGCLVRFFQRAFTQAALQTHKSAEQIEMIFWHYNDAVCKGEMSIQAFNEATSKALETEAWDWQKYYLDAIEPIRETHELVQWAAQHYQVGLLTNIMPGLVESMRAQKKLPDVDYEAIIDSSEVKAIKPEPAIFEKAQVAAGVAPQAILLVDDDRANVMAAERLGWHVLWFDDFHPSESVTRIKKNLEF